MQAAAVGSGMCGDGDIHIYLGTSAWVAAVSRTADKFMNRRRSDPKRRQEMNLIAGITESTGANIQWLQEQFSLPKRKSTEIRSLNTWMK